MGVIAVDLGRPPSRQLTNRALLAAVHAYRSQHARHVPWMGARCRFRPTCSRYAERALTNRGVIPGLVATGGRLLRCGPWTPQGTIDRPPPAANTDATGGSPVVPTNPPSP